VQHYRKNQYEEALFRAEDDHFELDMIIDQNASAIKALRVRAVGGVCACRVAFCAGLMVLKRRAGSHLQVASRG